ncbi:ATP-binding protein [Streptomyces sp. NPDC002643]
MVTVSPLDASLPRSWEYFLRLPHDPRAVRVARLTVRAALTSHGWDELLDVTELLTSELVTNAYLHTSTPATLRLLAFPEGRLTVFVGDYDPRIPPPFDRLSAAHSANPEPSPPTPTDDDEHGRGLLLVQRCADRWGCWPLEGGTRGLSGPPGRGRGKLVWFEVGGARTAAARLEAA